MGRKAYMSDESNIGTGSAKGIVPVYESKVAWPIDATTAVLFGASIAATECARLIWPHLER